MLMKFLLAIALLLLPAMAEAADITGVPKIRDGDQIMIGSSRIRLGGIDAPSADQLCLNHTGERWTCGVAARDALIHHTDKKSWTCHVLRTDPRGRYVAHCTVDGEDIQKWLVSSGWALSYTRFSHDYDADEKAAREAKAGMWQGAFIAPWDWRVRNKKTTILGATKPPHECATRFCWRRRLERSRPRPTAPSRAMSMAPANASFIRPKAAGMRRSRCRSARAPAGSARSRRPNRPAAAKPGAEMLFLSRRARVKRFSKSRTARLLPGPASPSRIIPRKINDDSSCRPGISGDPRAHHHARRSAAGDASPGARYLFRPDGGADRQPAARPRRLFATKGRAYIYIANGHGAWEAALTNVLSRGDKVLVLESGRFAIGWGDAAAAWAPRSRC